MTAPLPTMLPYGLRDVKLTPYTDASGSVLDDADGASIDLPNARTLSFSEAEDFDELTGDDRTVTTVGKGPKVDWSLESGGISFEAWKVLSGGTIAESGTAPARKKTFTKKGSTRRPWFRVEGQAISDSGGDVHCTIFRCRASDKLEGELSGGNFFLTACSGQGLPLLDESDDLLFEFVQNETAVTIPDDPVDNP